jgi:glycosyltransferase involved in cell wall biosynthesis/O-antigen/teichoic acid export membrane protein
VAELLRGALPLLLALGLLNASNFLFHVAVSRLLGPTSYGALAAILAIALVVSVPFGVVQAVVAKRVSLLRVLGQEGEIREATARATKGTAVVGVGLAVLFLAVSPLIAGPLHVGEGSVATLAPYVLFTLVLGVPLGAMQGRLRFAAMSAVVATAVAVRFGLGVGLVAAGWGVPGAVVASSASQGVALVLALGLLSVPRDVWRRAGPSLTMLRGGFASALLGIGAFWLFAETDLVLARHFLSDTDAGLYAAAGLLCRALLFFPAAVCWVALPRFSESHGRGDAARRWLNGAIGITTVLSVAALLLMVLLRKGIVLIAFGSSYRSAAGLIPVLALAMALLSIVNLLVYFHVAAESRSWLFLLFGMVAEIGLVAVFHSSPEQIALVVLFVAALVAVLQYRAAVAIYRWSPGPSRLAPYEQISGTLPVPDADLSVVIPSYNGGADLGPVVAHLTRVLDGIPSEIIVVSDGSTDDTTRVAERAGVAGLRVLHYPDRVGKGHALRVGLAEARGGYVAFIDGDGDIDPEGLRPFLTLMELYHPDIVLGSKRHPLSDVHYPFIRRVLSWMYHALGRVLFRVNVSDTQTGLKLVRRDVLVAVLPRMLEKRYAFDLELLVVARMLGYSRVFEAPVRIDYHFSSQVDLRAVVRILVDTLAIFYRRYVLDTYRRDPGSPSDITAEPGPARLVRVPDLGTSDGHLRILFLNWRDIANPEAGGAEVFTHEVARRWVEQGHEVSLLTSRFSECSPTETIDGVRIRRIGRLRSGSFHILAQRELARLRGFDLVIDEVNTIPFLTPLWRRRLPPVVTLIHQLAVDVWDSEMPRPMAALGRRVEPRLLRLYEDALVVTVSESTRDDLCRLGLQNVRVIPIGRDEPPDLNGVAKEDVPTFLFVGRLTANKRPDHALEAFRHILERLPEARLWIVGRGPMDEGLREQLPPGAEMFGYLSRRDLYERMARAHCLLVTSVREGWGMVITEANSVGTPAVGYDVPGVRDAIRDGESGLLAEAEPIALARAALSLVADRGAYASCRERSIWSARRFSWGRTADVLMSTALNGSRPRPEAARTESRL